MNEKIKKVFIIGNSFAVYALAKKFLAQDAEVFVAPGNEMLRESCEIVDIRESNVSELLEFALENAIDLTIAASEIAIENNITEFFQQNSQMIFAPSKESADICLRKSFGKKFMYKNRISHPRFGVFDKPNLALEHVQKSQMPVVIKTDSHIINGAKVCNSIASAKDYINELFLNDEKKVIIEDYIFGHEFSLYAITDGYHALKLESSHVYKWSLDGDGGELTRGMASVVPDYKIPLDVQNRVMSKVITPTLDALAKAQTPYVGILGVDLVLDDFGNIFVIEFNPFLNDTESLGILELLDENLYELFQACVVGSFADDYNGIKMKDRFAVSCLLKSRNSDTVIKGIEDLNDETSLAFLDCKKNAYLEYQTTGEKPLVVTTTAKVLSKALEDIYLEIDSIEFEGKRFRKDIC